MAIAPLVRARGTNTSKTKKSVSSAEPVATVIAQVVPLANIDTATEQISASGAVRVQLGIAR